jgi:hypothetical protein
MGLREQQHVFPREVPTAARAYHDASEFFVISDGINDKRVGGRLEVSFAPRPPFQGVTVMVIVTPVVAMKVLKRHAM